MKASISIAVFALVAVLVTAPPATAGEHRLGGGLRTWQTVDDLVGPGAGLDEDGLAPVLSYRWLPDRGLVGFSVELEVHDSYGGSADTAFAPIVLAIFGRGFYVGGGVGLTSSSGLPDDPSDPFYVARIGFDWRLLPGLFLDVHGDYRTNAFESLGDFDTDTFSLGAVVRVSLGGGK